VVKANLPVSKKGYYIQAGAFIFKDNLNVPRKKIESLGFRPKVKTGTKLIGMHRLLVGAWDDFLIAEDIAAKLKQKGFKAELTSKNERFCVLIGSYYYKNKADRKKKALKAKGFNSRIEKKRIKMKINYLLLGPYATSGKAAEITEVLDTKGLKTVIIQTK
jgi:cell division protein FtsN